MEGVVTAYTGTTLTVTVDLFAGTGAHTDWDINLAGDQGVPGSGVPPTVVAHGSMGATETFDYGDGPAHSGTVNASLTVTLTGWVAGENIMTLYLTTDGTGGYGVPTFGAEVINDADLAAVWDDTAGARNVIVLDTIDSGTNVYIMGLDTDTTPDLDAVIAASSGQDIADALSGAATPTAGNVFATMADVGGGGGGTNFAQIYIPAGNGTSSGGGWTIVTYGDISYATPGYQSSGAQNDAIAFDIFMEAGTYAVFCTFRKSTNTGIITVNLDGASQGTIDTYAGSVAYGSGSVTAITVTAGKRTWQLKAATKNGSSSSYFMELFYVLIMRTA
jgi:hypothetical protein